MLQRLEIYDNGAFDDNVYNDDISMKLVMMILIMKMVMLLTLKNIQMWVVLIMKTILITI